MMMELLLDDIKEYIEDAGYKVKSISESSEKSLGNLLIETKIKVDSEIHIVKLICCFPIGFPYRFPYIYLKKNKKTDLINNPIPHIDDNNLICTYSRLKTYPNHKKPKQVTIKCIQKAIKIIKEGLKETNSEDFREEFGAYWSQKNKEIFYGLFNNYDKPKQFFYIKIGKKFFICDSANKDNLKEWLSINNNYTYNNLDDHFKNALFLPLKTFHLPPFPKSNFEIYRYIKNTKYDKTFRKYLSSNLSLPLVVFSQNIQNKIYFGGWLHRPLKSVNGARKGHTIPQIVMLGSQKDDKIIRFNIDLLTKDRLFYRGGDNMGDVNYEITLVGCGSIGGYLLESLIKLGLKKFNLNDNEKLKSENIARHVCGANYLEKYKVESLRKKFLKHSLYLEMTTNTENVYSLLEKDLSIFNKSDFIFIATGDRNVEMKFNDLYINNKLKSSLIIFWVEPFCVAGHAFILQKNDENNFYKLFNKKRLFKYRVINNSDEFLQREAGCQSTFIPYSAFEVQKFITAFVDYFNKNFIRNEYPPNSNILFSWGGNLSYARKQSDIKLNKRWLSKDNNTRKILKVQNL